MRLDFQKTNFYDIFNEITNLNFLPMPKFYATDISPSSPFVKWMLKFRFVFFSNFSNKYFFFIIFFYIKKENIVNSNEDSSFLYFGERLERERFVCFLKKILICNWTVRKKKVWEKQLISKFNYFFSFIFMNWW